MRTTSVEGSTRFPLKEWRYALVFFSPPPSLRSRLSEEKGTPDIGKKAKIVIGQCLLGNSIPLKEILSLVFSTRL